ncbi:MAG: HPP family protein [Cyclobacterium sp.]|uniref:HPP family protein n=1 Tax=Cyclobacterium sp. TaxID=1966343 RepID=UPI003970909C
MKWSIGLTPAQAVALSILAMQYSKTLHSSEGAIALIANTGSSEIREMSCFLCNQCGFNRGYYPH